MLPSNASSHVSLVGLMNRNACRLGGDVCQARMTGLQVVRILRDEEMAFSLLVVPYQKIPMTEVFEAAKA